MNKDELFQLVSQYPGMGQRLLGSWLEENPLTDDFVDMFRQFLGNGFLSQISNVPIKYFMKNPNFFNKEKWLETTMDYHALEDEKFQEQFELDYKNLKEVSLKCNPANGHLDMCDTDIEFIKKNITKDWMTALIMRMSFEVVMNIQLEFDFVFKMEDVYPVRIAKMCDDRIGDLILNDVIGNNERVSIEMLTTYGTREDWVLTALEKKLFLMQDANCFNLVEIFNQIPEDKYSDCIKWLDDSSVFTQQLFNSLCEDIEFNINVKMNNLAIFSKYGVKIDDEDSGID